MGLPAVRVSHVLLGFGVFFRLSEYNIRCAQLSGRNLSSVTASWQAAGRCLCIWCPGVVTWWHLQPPPRLEHCQLPVVGLAHQATWDAEIGKCLILPPLERAELEHSRCHGELLGRCYLAVVDRLTTR